MKSIEAMSFDQLLAFREQLVALIGRKVTAARREITAQLDQLDRLTSGQSKRGRPAGRPHALRGRKVEPKYRGPKGETWAGRGMMPLWMRDQIKAGRKAEDFAIGKRGRPAKSKRRTSKK